MIQIIPEKREPSDIEKFMQMISSGMRGAAEGGPHLAEALRGKKERAQLGQLMGMDISDIRSPDFQKQLLGSHLNMQEEAAKLRGQYGADQENYETMKDAFGEKFADLWLATGQGERTNLTKTALEARARGIDIDKMLGQMTDPANEIPESSTKTPTKKGEVPDYKLNTENMNSKEIVEFKAMLRKENMPIWKETIDNLGEYKELDRDISILDTINEKGNLPEGLDKLLIDPETGAPYPRGTIIKNPNRDVQQWGKTIARQATRAQTAFPGRVTNFDLTSYMRQFPSLFNTYEGRKVVLKQMQLANKANLLMNQAMDKVYAKHKLGGITPEDAFDQARSMVDNQINDIDRQLIELAEEGEILSAPDEQMQSRTVDVIGPDGQLYEIDENEVDQLPSGYRVK